MTQGLPARPDLPFTVSEDIWRTLEASEAYRNSPRPRPYRISYQISVQVEYTGAKSSRLKRPAATIANATRESTALGGKCALQHKWDATKVAGQDITSDDYICGGTLSLGSTAGSKTTGFIKRLDELKGSLLPIRIGNQMSLRFQTAYLPNRRFDSTIATSCQVISQGAANELHPRLKGTAWKIRCQGNVTSDYDHKPISSEIDDYYLEDLGLRLSAIGQLDFLEKKFILPQPGDQTVLVAEGDYGSRITTTYLSYDWSMDSEDQETSPSRPPVQPAFSAGAREKWGLADQDLSIMLGTDIMKKVHMAERKPDILAAAQAGDMLSQYLIGSSYAYGVGVNEDDVQKVYWLTKSAEQGLVRAYAALGDARIRGEGMPQDDITGWTWLMKSANAGNATGQYIAAILTLQGLDVGNGMARQYHFLKETDALAMLTRSAEAGMPAAQYSLGHSYLEGTDLNKKDLTQARYWLGKAAAQNFSPAIKTLATMSQNN